MITVPPRASLLTPTEADPLPSTWHSPGDASAHASQQGLHGRVLRPLLRIQAPLDLQKQTLGGAHSLHPLATR